MVINNYNVTYVLVIKLLFQAFELKTNQSSNATICIMFSLNVTGLIKECVVRNIDNDDDETLRNSLLVMIYLMSVAVAILIVIATVVCCQKRRKHKKRKFHLKKQSRTDSLDQPCPNGDTKGEYETIESPYEK